MPIMVVRSTPVSASPPEEVHMLKERITQALHWLRMAITEPQSELTRWEKAVRYVYDLGVHGYRALNRDKAPQMASALAFRTIFALLPVVVVSSVVVKAFGGMEPFRKLVARVIQAMGIYDLQFTPPDNGAAVSAIHEVKPVVLGPWLEQIVSDAAGFNFATLGWIGLLVVVYSAIWTMVTIENSFNSVYGAPEGRPWVQRVLLYWAVLTLGPLFIGVTILVDNQFSQVISGLEAWGWALAAAKAIWGLIVVWLLMFAVYRLVPNTQVNSKAALIGGLVAAILLQFGRSMLGWYFSAVSFQNIFASLGLVPILMFGIYLMWVVVLFGLEVSATIQMLGGRAFAEMQEKQPQNGLVDPVQVVNVMEIVTERFAQGLPTPSREISDQTRIPETLVAMLVDRLSKAGVVHRVEGAENAITLAKPPEQISGERLLEIGFALVDEGGVGRVSPLVGRLREAQRRLAGQTTLAALLPVGGAPTDQAAAT